jgi:AraC-like DNA-binding protein
MVAKLHSAAPASPRNPEALRRAVASEVRSICAELGARGWTLLEIAVAVGASETQLRAWRTNTAEPRASKLEALRELRRLEAA